MMEDSYFVEVCWDLIHGRLPAMYGIRISWKQFIVLRELLRVSPVASIDKKESWYTVVLCTRVEHRNQVLPRML